MFRLKVRVGSHNAGVQADSNTASSEVKKDEVNGDLAEIEDEDEEILFKIQAVAKKSRPQQAVIEEQLKGDKRFS